MDKSVFVISIVSQHWHKSTQHDSLCMKQLMQEDVAKYCCSLFMSLKGRTK